MKTPAPHGRLQPYWLPALFCLLLSPFSHAAQPGKAAIASAHPLATDAGLEVLAQGGNAFDAAVAVAAVLSVVEPYSAGMGGGGFWLLHDEQNQQQVMVDAREKAPAAATRDMYLNSEGEVERNWAINGPAAAGIPGQAAAFAHIASKYGKLPLKQSLAAAISYAENGFPVDEVYRKLALYRQEVLTQDPEASRIFLTNGNVPDEGHLIVQPELAQALRLLAEQGHDGFYRGPFAEKLAQGVQLGGGIWTKQDLHDYQVVERQPVIGQFRNARIISAAPPSSGGIVLLQALHVLDAVTGESQSQQPHQVIESMRRAYRDRAEYLGDPDFVSIPTEKLLSQEYAAKLAASIQADAPTPSSALGDPVEDGTDGHHTTHLSVMDTAGNRVSATLSINLPFGSAFVPQGTGILLNNEMDDFSAKPGAPNAYGLIGSQANAIAPGKRPLSSMTPTFIEWDNQVAILGTPGGSRIISMVMLGILEALQGNPVKDWVSRPRYHHQYLPDQVQVEPFFFGGADTKKLLGMGHKVKSTGRNYGNMQAILWNRETGAVSAASDPRRIGKASVMTTAELAELASEEPKENKQATQDNTEQTE